MSQINLKSITGITSITTPAGVDNVFTVHSNDTTERFRVDSNGNQVIAGILTVTTLDLNGDLDVDGHLNVDNLSIAGVTTAAGNVNMGGGNLIFGDSGGDSDDKLVFGAGSDFKIFHNGSNNYIDVAGNGHLYIRPKANFYIQDYTNGEVWIDGSLNGGVQLYNNGLLKLATDGNGITVHGNINMATDSTLQLGVGNDFKLFHNGTTNYIRSANGTIQIDNNSGVPNAQFIPGQGTRLYYGASVKFTTETSGVNITGIVTATSADINGDLDVDGHTNLDNVSIAGVTTNTSATYFDNQVYWRHSGSNKMFTLSNNGGMNWQDSVKAEFGNSGDLKIYHESGVNYIYGSGTNFPTVFMTSAIERLRITSDGDITFGVQSGGGAPNSSTQIRHFDFGRDHWNSTAGDYRALRLKVYNVSSDDVYGFGISSNTLEVQSQQNIGFYAGTSGGGTGRRQLRILLDSSANSLDFESNTNLYLKGTASNPTRHAKINIGRESSGETRAIDIWGSWGSGENKSITFNHGSTTTEIVGQINCIHTSPGSSLRFGKLYHSGDSSYYSMTLDSTSSAGADLNLTNGNLKVASGHGIDFSATSNSSGTTESELLDDYEFGVFTPTMYTNTNINSTSGENSSHTGGGQYVKVGKLVTVTVDFNNLHGNAADHVLRYITGLPFTSRSNNTTTAAIGYQRGLRFAYSTSIETTNMHHLYGHIGGSTDRISLNASKGSSPYSGWPATHNTTSQSQYLRITISYFTS